MSDILSVKDLHTYFFTNSAVNKAVEGVSFNLRKGQILGLVGESACGKTVTAYSIMRLVQSPGKIVKGEVSFKGKELFGLPESKMRNIRGNNISMIFQEPVSALNPLYTIGFQIDEMIKAHNKSIPKKRRKEIGLELLEKVDISEPARIFKSYPHTLSGGEAQRAGIAMAISCNPEVLIADEPTTALDVTIQVQVIDLFNKLKEKQQFSFIFITHDLRLASHFCDRIAVMYAGKIVESAGREEILNNPLHPYTKALLASVPGRAAPKENLPVIRGTVPDSFNKPGGCYFNPCCPDRIKGCLKDYPSLKQAGKDHWVSCFVVQG